MSKIPQATKELVDGKYTITLTDCYYSNQLQKPLDSWMDDSLHSMQLQVIHEGIETKWLNLNLDCIESLRAMLDIAEEELLRKEELIDQD